ncbi:hypothetical protein [Fusobacterium polymorphum]|jgi:hypothetical protein|uniref:CRISPR-associated protein n=2 Tax=Fusobacterium TaxID=848 RepID=A0A241Q0Y7_FUSNP|nr:MULTISPECIES: hypothetical protein [Fusobacterium]ASG28454.1 hypothetical protein CBG61_05625 [Fusobacterium polymorphum]ETZ29906.1 hypothetical protein HMPREF2085_00304 [Fusobacterium nucleatum 13_3C]
MDKKEFEKEIEKNIKNMGYIDGEKLSPEGEILKKLYLEHKSIGIEVNEKIISNEVEKIYENRLKKESEKLNIDVNQIKVLISTIGVVNEKIKTILDESTVEKNLRVFTKIEKIYIFHTESSKEHFENLKKRINSKYKDNVEVIGSLVEETIIKTNKYLVNLLKNITKSYDREEIIMDITLGMKLTAIPMYRLSVDNGIKVVNWKEIFLPIYEEENGVFKSKKSNRVTFSTTLELIKEALSENRQLLIEINNSLDRGEYETVASYYEKIGRKEKEDFFKELGKLLSLDVLLAYNTSVFAEKLDNFVKKLLENNNENEYSSNIKSIIVFLKIISDLKYVDEENYNKSFIEELKKRYKEKYGELDFDNIDNLGENFLNVLKNYYKREMKNITYLETDFYFDSDKFSSLNDIVDLILHLIEVENKNDIDDEYEESNLYLNIDNIYIYLATNIIFRKVKNIESLKKVFKVDKGISNLEDINKINLYLFEAGDNSRTERNINIVKKVFDFSTFKEKIPNIINYKDGVLQFLNLGIEIDLKDKDIILNEWNERILNAIISKEDYEVSDAYLKDYLEKNYNCKFNTYKNKKVDFKKFIIALNKIIIDELKEKNVNEADLREFIEPPSNERGKEKILYKVDNYYFD